MPRRPRRLAVVVLVGATCALAALAACSIGVDFDAYSMGGTDGGADEPTIEIDAAEDSDAPEVVPDAGFCANRDAYILCDDFDGTFDAGWNAVRLADGGVGPIDSVSVSPPRALLATRPAIRRLDAGLPEITSGGFLYKEVDPKLRNALVEADVRSCSPTDGFINHLAFYDTHSAVAMGIGFDGAPKAFTFANLGTSFVAPSFSIDPLPTHRFAHLRWTVQFDTAVGSVKLEVDGKVVIHIQNIATTRPSVSQRAFQVGVISSQDNPECKVYFDNVTLTMTP